MSAVVSSPAMASPSRRRRWGVVSSAMVFAALATALVTVPAHATTVNYGCGSGSYKTGLGRLGAFTCDGTGSTNVVVSVSVVDVSGGGSQDGSGLFFCSDFGPSGVPGHWSGDCVFTS
jgi:hypothetical protein